MIPNTSNATEDFADLLVWDERTYISADSVASTHATPASVRTGPLVGAVTCSLIDGPLSDVEERLANLPWPDGTATALRQGTTIYAVRDQPNRCMLAAHRDNELIGYVAIDTGDSSWPQLC